VSVDGTPDAIDALKQGLLALAIDEVNKAGAGQAETAPAGKGSFYVTSNSPHPLFFVQQLRDHSA
jgi:hypothetical protein